MSMRTHGIEEAHNVLPCISLLSIKLLELGYFVFRMVRLGSHFGEVRQLQV